MRKLFVGLICLVIVLSGCSKSDGIPEILEIGDSFSITGVVDYSDEPSDIGQEYCFVTISEKTEYYYKDIYGERSKWSSDVFFTKGDDTAVLKEYVGSEVTVSGTFDAESHGIPYITEITVTEK